MVRAVISIGSERVPGEHNHIFDYGCYVKKIQIILVLCRFSIIKDINQGGFRLLCRDFDYSANLVPKGRRALRQIGVLGFMIVQILFSGTCMKSPGSLGEQHLSRKCMRELDRPPLLPNQHTELSMTTRQLMSNVNGIRPKPVKHPKVVNFCVV